MWFLPRVSGLVILAVIGALLILLATDFEVEAIIGVVGGIGFVVLLLGIVFDLWEPPKK